MVARLTLIVLCTFAVADALDRVDVMMHQAILDPGKNSTEAIFHVPESLTEIVLARRGIHAFLAEYDRVLILRSSGQEVLRIAAATDTGGNSRMNVYQVSRWEFFLEGRHDSDRFLLNTLKPAVERHMGGERPAAAQFLGTFDRDEQGWRFIAAHVLKRRIDHREGAN